jgi:RNA recognition motif-containing protein
MLDLLCFYYLGFAYIEYFTPEDAQNAMKHMDGGQIDGQVQSFETY